VPLLRSQLLRDLAILDQNNFGTQKEKLSKREDMASHPSDIKSLVS